MNWQIIFVCKKLETPTDLYYCIRYRGVGSKLKVVGLNVSSLYAMDILQIEEPFQLEVGYIATYLRSNTTI